MPALVYIAENSQSVSYPLNKGVFNIGNRDDANLQLPSSQIMPEHAAVIFEDGQYVLHDYGSESGSYLNGERVTTSAPLKHNDIVRFGEYRFRVNAMDSAPLAGVNNPNMETSRIDMPPHALRRSTQGMPTVSEVRRVVEMRPQSLKSAETSQIEPAGLPNKVKVSVGKVESAVVRKSNVSVRVPGPTAVAPAVEETKKSLPSWVWFLAGAILASAATAGVMLLLK